LTLRRRKPAPPKLKLTPGLADLLNIMWWIVTAVALAFCLLFFQSKTGRFFKLWPRAESAFARRSWHEAESLYRQTLVVAKSRGDSKSNYCRHCQVQIARIRYRLGDLAEAESLFRESLTGWEPDAPQVFDDLCFGHVTWGQLSMDRSCYAEAQEHLHKAILLREKSGNKGWLIMELQTLGDALLRQEKFDEAETVLTRSNDIEKQVIHESLVRQGKNPGSTVMISMSQPDVYFSQRRWPEALKVYQEKVTHWERSLTRPDNVDLGHLQMRLAQVQAHLGDAAQAAQTYRHAAESFKRDWSDEHPRVACALARLSEALSVSSQQEEARRAAKSALRLFESNSIPRHPEAEACRRVLGLETRA
jgi:tetratricopeptide (TPR) repeat protein